MELLVVQYYREDADFNQKKSPRSDKKCQSYEVSKFPKFCQKFYPIFRVHSFVWVKIMGEEKKFSKKKIGGKFFWGEIFLFFENIFGNHFYISQFVPL